MVWWCGGVYRRMPDKIEKTYAVKLTESSESLYSERMYASQAYGDCRLRLPCKLHVLIALLNQMPRSSRSPTCFIVRCERLALDNLSTGARVR